MNTRLLFIFLSLATCYLLSAAMTPIHAAVDIKDVFEPAKNFSDVGSLLNVLVPNFMIVSGIVVFIGIIVAGFKVVQSAGSGDPNELENAKKALVGLIVGFLLIFGAYWIVQIVEFITGTNIFNSLF